MQHAHKRLEQRLAQQEQTSQTSNLETAELQAMIKESKNAFTREADKCSRLEKAMADLKEKNKELQKELDDLVKDDTGRSGEVRPGTNVFAF
jgi:poly-D-alanine transfer protein DltD